MVTLPYSHNWINEPPDQSTPLNTPVPFVSSVARGYHLSFMSYKPKRMGKGMEVNKPQ
jgi:hypothetical protein